MSDIDLNRLRKLRSRAEDLLASLVSDLKPFRHAEETNGFVRKPTSESASDDINVTTTCSCLMALALSEKLGEFYGENSKNKVKEIFGKLVAAPWMSSGLTEDNAFTTTLMIRLFGFLVGSGVMAPKVASEISKLWEPRLEFKDFKPLAEKLTGGKESFPIFLFDLFPRGLQERLKSFVKTLEKPEKVESQVSNELIRLISATPFDEIKRFEAVPPSKQTSELRAKKPNGYLIAQLNRSLLHDCFANEIKPLDLKSLADIASDMCAETVPDMSRFRINDYPTAAAVVYWFIDGVVRGEIDLKDGQWTRLCRFAAEEFGRQRSLLAARHAAMMDPVAMAMSACLCARLRKISKELRCGTTEEHHSMLPSTLELEKSIVELFAEQTSGIWPKYFPLFHYQDAGSNFCFTFELLEAVLVEFGGTPNRLLTEEAVITGLEHAVDWCESNRLQCFENSPTGAIPYKGWNSGGNLEPLRRGQPESWATAVVHMFLWELVDVLSRHIQKRLLESYGARTPAANWNKVKDLLDIDLLLDRHIESLKETLLSTIVATFRDFQSTNGGRLRRRPIKKEPLSALLFGPPGTSKTEVAKAIAQELGWPLVEIDPSRFLQDGFQNIYVQAERIFQDVMDLYGVVLLFDEMDALVQKRDSDTSLDTESKFLTTYMLPKLAKLHERGQLLFLMATNFQGSFDDAIKRAGRFDFLLCMGPPTLKAKCDSISVFFGSDKHKDESTAAGEAILKYAAANPWIEDQLSLFTYGDFQSFITGIGEASTIGQKLVSYGQDGFLDLVKNFSQSVGLRLDDLKILTQISDLADCKRLADFDSKDFDEKTIKLSKAQIDPKIPAIKYILDRKQTRRQYAKSAKKL